MLCRAPRPRTAVIPSPTQTALSRNLELLERFALLRSLLFWLPVFFLYFQRSLPVEQVLELAAIYYLGTVLCEVPSGYLSDRVGRRPTLLAAMFASVLGCALFLGQLSFWSFALGQLCFAASTAFVSGTDTALLYDSLRALGREDEHAALEGRIQAKSFAGLALASFSGGALAGFDLRVAYVLTLLGSLAALIVALRLSEPPLHAARRFGGQLADCVRQLSDPALRWVFAFAVGMFVINHVPFEFLQPWVGFLLGADVSGWSPAPALAGALLGSTMLISSWVSGRVVFVRARLGSAGTLLLATGLQCLILCGMGSAIHVALLPLIALRSVPQALGIPVTRAEIHPRIDPSLRATYLSLQSLIGRLSFSLCLGLAARLGVGSEWSPEQLSRLLLAFAAGALLLWSALWVTRASLRARAGSAVQD